MDAHGGLLTVASKGIGHGCTFSIQLPITVPATSLAPITSPVPGSVCATDPRQGEVGEQQPVAPSPWTDAESNRKSLWPRHRLSSIRVTNFEDSVIAGSNSCDNSLYHVVVEKQREQQLTPRGASYSVVSRPKYARVLVVDDVAMNRKMLLRLLRDRFESHCEACNGQEAVDQVRASMSSGSGSGMAFDVITMDYQMPVMDGTKAARAIRELGYTGVIVGITGNALPEDMKTFMSHGANEVLTKPIDMAAFDNALLRCTRRIDAFT